MYRFLISEHFFCQIPKYTIIGSNMTISPLGFQKFTTPVPPRIRLAPSHRAPRFDVRPLLILSLFPEPDRENFRSVGRSEKKNYLPKIVKKIVNSREKQ